MINTSLVHHFENAKAHGVTQKEIAAVITHIAFYAGWPKGWAAYIPKHIYSPLNIIGGGSEWIILTKGSLNH